MKPPFPSLTAEWHDDTHGAISPRRPELSLHGKTVVVSGGGAGIGRGIAQACAEAGAYAVAILGRREALLRETKQDILSRNGNVLIWTHVVDVTDIAAVKKAAQDIAKRGKWDVLVSNAGYMPTAAPVAESAGDDWWKAFEINVKGSFNLAQAFLPTRSSNATIISVNAGSIQVPGAFSATYSSYNSSKIATLKFFEILAVENPDVHVVSMHPGVVDTDMMRKGDMKSPHVDTLELPSHFTVWLCSEEAKFLRGKFVWANWDVEEMKSKKAEIEGSLLLTANCIGWPFDA